MRRKEKTVVFFLGLQNLSFPLTLLHVTTCIESGGGGVEIACTRSNCMCARYCFAQLLTSPSRSKTFCDSLPSTWPALALRAFCMLTLTVAPVSPLGHLFQPESWPRRPDTFLLNERTGAIALLFVQGRSFLTPTFLAPSFLPLWVCWVSGFFALSCCPNLVLLKRVWASELVVPM